MTGSGFPQRFADLDGSLIDVYQSMTQVTDEVNEIAPTTTQIHALLDNALGPEQYYGVFNVILHSDYGDHRRLNDLVADAQRPRRARGQLRPDARLAGRPKRLVLRQHRYAGNAEVLADHAAPRRVASRRCCPRARHQARCRA